LEHFFIFPDIGTNNSRWLKPPTSDVIRPQYESFLKWGGTRTIQVMDDHRHGILRTNFHSDGEMSALAHIDLQKLGVN
jgi:hypothetical protein